MNTIDTQNTTISQAPLSEFKALRSTILLGQELADVKHIERSIAQFGLISPLIVSKTRQGLIVIDGKKRLTAIKRMAFKGTLPRSLVNISYILIENADATEIPMMSVLSLRDFYSAVTTLKSQGHSVDSIAGQLYLCRRTVTDFIRLSHLCLPIRNALFKNIISFDQAKAYAAIPDEEAQIAVLKDLGPFAKPSAILEAMESLRNAFDIKAAQDTQVNFESPEFALTSDDFVTLPSSGKSFVWAQAA